MSTNEIIIGGSHHPVFCPVHLWTETSMSFAPGKGARKRVKEIDLCVWHYTGGEGDAKKLYDTLISKGYGVEFFISIEGEIWQFCDPTLVDTFDAGIVNPRSIGVEIQNYGTRLDPDIIPMIGRNREKYDASINGNSYRFAKFYPRQIEAAKALANAFKIGFGIPLKLPLDMNDKLVTDTLDSNELLSFKGHVGHYHITTQKRDPGTQLLEEFRKEWYDRERSSQNSI